MRRASLNEVSVELEPILLAKISPTDFSRLFPVEMSEMDPFAAAEPSIGGIIQLNNGQYLGVSYGRVSGTLMIRIPPRDEEAVALEKILDEIPLEHTDVWWRRDKGLITPQ